MGRTSKLASLDFRQTSINGKVAGVYVRVSSNDLVKYRGADKAKAYRKSVLTQEEDGVKVATSAGWQFKVFKKDCNMSGFESDDRPDINEIISLIKAGKIHTLICRDPKRLTRSARFGSTLLHDVLLKYGCNLLCYDNPVDIATPDGQDTFLRSCSRGQQELQYISKVSRRNREALVCEGGFSGKPPFGYRIKGREKNVVEVVPHQAEIVIEIFTRYDNGEGMPTICRDMSRRQVPRTSTKSKDWQVNGVSNILRGRQYIGEIPYNGKIYPSPFPPIIDRDLFERVQTKIAINGKRGNRAKGSPHLLAEIIQCGSCHDSTSQTYAVYPNMAFFKFKHITRYYCQTRARFGADRCTSAGSINSDVIEAWVKDYIATLCIVGLPRGNDAGRKSIQDSINGINGTISKLQSKKLSLIKVFSAMDDANPNDLAQALSDINGRISSQESDKEGLESKLETMDIQDDDKTKSSLQIWDTLTIQAKRAALKKVIEKILVYPDKIKVTMVSRSDWTIIIPVIRPKGYKTIIGGSHADLKDALVTINNSGVVGTIKYHTLHQAPAGCEITLNGGTAIVFKGTFKRAKKSITTGEITIIE